MATARLKEATTPLVIKRRKLNRNVAASVLTSQGEPSPTFHRDVATALRELTEAVEELQGLRPYTEDRDANLLPKHLSVSPLFQAQFLRIISNGAGNVQPIQHGLQRVPQGAIVTVQGDNHIRVYIAADPTSNVPPADTATVHVRMDGPVGEEAVILLF